MNKQTQFKKVYSYILTFNKVELFKGSKTMCLGRLCLFFPLIRHAVPGIHDDLKYLLEAFLWMGCFVEIACELYTTLSAVIYHTHVLDFFFGMYEAGIINPFLGWSLQKWWIHLQASEENFRNPVQCTMIAPAMVPLGDLAIPGTSCLINEKRQSSPRRMVFDLLNSSTFFKVKILYTFINCVCLFIWYYFTGNLHHQFHMHSWNTFWDMEL